VLQCGLVVMLWLIRFHCPGIWISTGLPCIYIYSWLYVYSVLTCAKLDMHQTFQSISIAYVRVCYCVCQSALACVTSAVLCKCHCTRINEFCACYRFVHLPFFDRVVKGCFVRVGIGSHNGRPVYRVSSISAQTSLYR
jgi:hypothetical protein